MNKSLLYSLLGTCIMTLMMTDVYPQGKDSLTAKFKVYNETVVNEKLFVHHDRPSYVCGETMWFKVYCTEAGSNRPLAMSKVAYVEIIDRSGKSILQSKIALKNGKGSGNFFLPATLETDTYRLRAYTNWMKNFPSEYFFTSDIQIVNAFKATTGNTAKLQSKIDAQFFPEGGQLLAGFTSTVGFRVVDQNGRGISFTGIVQDANGNTVVNFAPSRFGLGRFSFTPEQNSVYTAIIKDDQGQSSSINLPVVNTEGYAMRVAEAETAYSVTVAAAGFDEPVIYLLAHTQNQNVLIESAFLKNGLAQLSISKERLGTGVSHITIFDSRLQPVAERLIYRRPKSESNLKIRTDQMDYSARRKVKMTLKLDSNHASTDTFDLSLAVFKKDSLSSSSQRDITTYVALLSDLHGNIESPEYYFQQGTAEDFDNLMLTHGWRKFSWSSILNREIAPKYLPEIEGATFNARISDEAGRPAGGIGTFLSSPSRNVQLRTSISDINGRISFPLGAIEGTDKMLLQTNFSKDSLYKFEVTSPFAPSAPLNFPPTDLKKNLQQSILSRSVAMQVQDIYFEDEQVRSEQVDTVAFYGKADETYFLDDYTRFPVMEEVMREYVKGVWVRKRQGDFYFLVMDNINKAVFNTNPLVMVDGVPFFKINHVMSINPLLVKKIEVLTREFYIGRLSFPGVVSFTTYSGELAGIRLDPKNFVVDYEGLQRLRTFFAPVYGTERQRSSRLPDQRHLLLWNPSIPLVGNVAEIECSTSDLTGTFEVNVQGLSNKGSTTSATATFSVSNFNN